MHIQKNVNQSVIIIAYLIPYHDQEPITSRGLTFLLLIVANGSSKEGQETMHKFLSTAKVTCHCHCLEETVAS